MNITSNLCWSNLWDNYTLQYVGPDVLTVRQGNTIKFMDMKTKATVFFKCETPVNGVDISVYCGHNRIPLFAIAEVILRPNIYVYKYPEMVRITSLPRLDIVQYIDLRFSEYDLLVAMGGYPDYSICVFNFRKGELLIRHATNVPCDKYCIYMEIHQVPIYAQYSRYENKILCYEMASYESNQISMKVVAEFELDARFRKSKFFMCYSPDDYRLHVVDDFGNFYSTDFSDRSLLLRWSPPQEKRPSKPKVVEQQQQQQQQQPQQEQPQQEGAEAQKKEEVEAEMEPEEEPKLEGQSHMINYYRGGYFINNLTKGYYIKKKAASMSLEWTMDNLKMEISKFICPSNGEIYGMTEYGAVFNFTLENNDAVVKKISPTGGPIKDYTIIRGIKDEAVLLLKTGGVLQLVELLRATKLSLFTIEGANTVCAHNTQPIVAVGTAKGHLILVTYEKSLNPVIIYDLECNTPGVERIQIVESTFFYEDAEGQFHFALMEMKPIKLTMSHTIDEQELTRGVFILNYFLIDPSRILYFVNRAPKERIQFATEMWLIYWTTKDRQLRRIEYDLPGKYVNVCIVPSVVRGSGTIEFAAIPKDTTMFETFQIGNIPGSNLHKVSRTRTTHFMPICNLYATRNLLTWGVDGLVVHFRSHKRSSKPFIISRYLKLFFSPRIIHRTEECGNFKYLIVFYRNGLMRVVRLPSLLDNLRENTSLELVEPRKVAGESDGASEMGEEEEEEEKTEFEPKAFVNTPLNLLTNVVKEVEYSSATLRKRDKVFQMIAEFSQKVTELIDYDMSVTGKSQGIFKKFCFNYSWLDRLTAEARKLCAVERRSIEVAIEDQARIRDWILSLITQDSEGIHYKVRAIFADANFENYAMSKKIDMSVFDKYRFYDWEAFMVTSISDELSMEDMRQSTAFGEEEEEGDMEEQKGFKALNRFVIEGKNVFEYMMAPQFALQDRKLVTSNQVYNDFVKYKYYLNEPLKLEFNKLFHEAQQFKQETITAVKNTNATLYKIYDNMNIMLRLLKMPQFTVAVLSEPEWERDEVVARIMEVDDSELKAINRRKRKIIDTGGKRGRLLLWATDFWTRALITMMDGVVEKLWEEEIKKDLPIPEFVLKKDPTEFNLEEQKLFRIYEEAVVQLAEDRRKYLRILGENEIKTLELKTQQILKLNTHVTDLMRLKLKYDFALKHNIIRMLNLQTIHLIRQGLRDNIKELRTKDDNLENYIDVNNHVVEHGEALLQDIKQRLEAVQSRDKAIERQFRNNYLNTVPHASQEMTKLYRKRPKIPGKLFSSPLLCSETANKLTGKQTQRAAFPLPEEVHEFIAIIDDIDNPKNCPGSIDQKSWDTFIKLRRQKVESELRIKGVMLTLLDVTNGMTRVNKDIVALKDTRGENQTLLGDTVQKYIECQRNATLQLTLSLGQVEVEVGGAAPNLAGSVLMHVNDINQINALIKEAGAKKLKSMMRVAVFRRKVIFKEWEHKVHRANIEYLKYMLEAVEKCKVSAEFLTILRNWSKVKKEREKFMADGAIERVIEQKLAAFRNGIERLNIKIDIVKDKVHHLKRENHSINQQIERMKVDITLFSMNRDHMLEEKRDREQRERMSRIKCHAKLMDTIRADYARIMELKTIAELLRMRTYPTLGPAPPHCPGLPFVIEN